MNTFPPNPFERMKIHDAIRDNNHPSIFAEVCRQAVLDGRPNDAVKMIDDQIKDNPALVREMFGDFVVDGIIALRPKMHRVMAQAMAPFIKHINS